MPRFICSHASTLRERFVMPHGSRPWLRGSRSDRYPVTPYMDFPNNVTLDGSLNVTLDGDIGVTR